MDEDSKKSLYAAIKDIIISVIVVAIIFGGLYAYTQVWPPIVVIESGSMQHGSDSHIGTIDTGDIVLVKRIYSPDDVITYVEGRIKGYQTYGDYGDVIIYHCRGDSIIHRAIVYLQWDGHRWKIRGWEHRDFSVDLKFVNLTRWSYKGYEMVNITLYATHVGDKIRITGSQIRISAEGISKKDMRDILKMSSIKLSPGNTISTGTYIYIQNLNISVGSKNWNKLNVVLYDGYTHTSQEIPLSDIVYSEKTYDLTYPSWLYVTSEDITIYNMGYTHRTFVLPLSTLNHLVVGDEGFVTMGDHNLATEGSNGYDQNPVMPICRHLVNYTMIEGVARGELPWFGAIKLYFTGTNTNEIPPSTNIWLGISIATIIAVSFLIDYVIDHRREIWDKIRHVFKKDYEEE